MALWKRERERALERAEHARAGPPRPRLDELDPYKLRYVLAVALVGAFVVAGGNAPDRLARAFLPDPGPLLGDQPMAIEAWATPAEYTHAAPISLSDLIGERVATPPSVRSDSARDRAGRRAGSGVRWPRRASRGALRARG